MQCRENFTKYREIGSTYGSVTTHTSEDSNFTIEMNSTSIVLSNEELSEISDLIVFGKVTDQRAAPKSIVEEFADPKRKGETVEATFIHHMVLLSFQVDEYFKGTGPKEITIATFDSDKHPVHLKIEQSQLYILYLNQPRTKEDQEFFENAYYIGTVDQGVWEVRGDLAVQQFGGGKFARLANSETLLCLNATELLRQ